MPEEHDTAALARRWAEKAGLGPVTQGTLAMSARDEPWPVIGVVVEEMERRGFGCESESWLEETGERWHLYGFTRDGYRDEAASPDRLIAAFSAANAALEAGGEE